MQGTNLGEKQHSAPMQPTMNMDTAAKTLNLQTDVKVSEVEAMIYDDFTKTDKRWSNKPTAPYLVSFGEGLVVEAYKRSHLYKGCRVGAREFQVKYVGDGTNDANKQDEYDNGDGIPSHQIPLFERVRDVTVDEDGTMHCSCCRFQRSGVFCEQQICIAQLVHEARGEKFAGFTHHDVSVRYWSSYMHLAYKESTPGHIRQLFHRLAVQDVSGPKLAGDIPDSLKIQDRHVHLPALERLKNYKPQDINLEQIDGMLSTTYTPNSQAEEEDDMLYKSMSEALQDMTTPDAEELFDLSSSDACLPEAATKGVKARDILKQHVESSFQLADQHGQEGIKQLEAMHLEFQTWCNSREASMDKSKNDESVSTIVSKSNESETTRGSQTKNVSKRKFVAMTDCKYTASQKRVLNTHNMRR